MPEYQVSLEHHYKQQAQTQATERISRGNDATCHFSVHVKQVLYTILQECVQNLQEHNLEAHQNTDDHQHLHEVSKYCLLDGGKAAIVVVDHDT